MFLYNLLSLLGKQITVVFCLFFICSCHSIDRINGEKTILDQRNNQIEQIDFTIENDLIIIPIHIDGEKYRFLFDTGSPTLISEQLSKKINLTQQKQIKTIDSQGNSQRLNYVKINEIAIENKQFNNISAGIVDFQQTAAIACLNIDGVIGANIIRKFCWQIDYTNKKIWISSIATSLLSSSEKRKKRYCLPFSVDINGTPIIPMKIGRTEIKNFRMDTGSVSFVSIDKDYYDELNQTNTILKQRVSYGTNLVGLFGTADKDTIKQLLITELTIGDKLSLLHQTIDLRPTNLSLMGNAFLRNFLVTIDSENNCLLLEPLSEIQNYFAHSFGIALQKENSKIIVSMLTEGSSAQSCGLQIGDTILQINGLDVTNSCQEDYCQIIRWFRNREIDNMYLVWDKHGIKNDCQLFALPYLSNNETNKDSNNY